MYVCSASRGQERALELQKPGVTAGYKWPCGCWESNLHPPQEQPGLLTTQSPTVEFFNLTTQCQNVLDFRASRISDTEIHYALPVLSSPNARIDLATVTTACQKH